jgi:glyoxylase-like metal-dependent hydrolase (beta-lactamase superfamily II)
MTVTDTNSRPAADPAIIDLRWLGQPGVIASYLLAAGHDLALIETGPGNTIPALLDGIRQAGYDPAQVTKLILTHIHLDHAGGAGGLLAHMPQAQVYVHEVGAPHLIHPEKLLASAQRIYGDDMERLWGAFLPVPEERLVVLRDGDTVQAGPRTLEALYTPGHASHHIALWDAASKQIWTGDVAGVRLETAYVRPPTPPPDLDLDLWKASVERIIALQPTTLYLTHFGPFTDMDRHFYELGHRLFTWGGIIESGMRQGMRRDDLIAILQGAGDFALRQITEDDALVARYEQAASYEMSVDGYIRYYRKRNPELADWKG